MRLSEYFHPPHLRKALAKYAMDMGSDWPITGKLDLYNAGKLAFASDADETEKRASFDQIYDELKRRGVFNGPSGPCWDAETVYSTLVQRCGDCSVSSGLTLHSLGSDARAGVKIRATLDSMTDLKPMGEYPHMAVSKFLHFFNPRLFPIYDRDFIWKKVCVRAFGEEYREMCSRLGMIAYETTAAFNLNYTKWAGECVAQASPGFMGCFGDWFRREVGNHPDPQDVLGEIEHYHATAFEFVAIGAASLELS